MKTKNKSFKRLFAFLVALVMVTALVPSVIFAADATFPDVPASHWAYDYIEELAEAEIISGYADGTFGPENNVTRQQAAKMIAKAADLEAGINFTSKFTDLDKVADELKPFVLALEENKVVGGFADGSFGPTLNIKRSQAAKMIVNAFGLVMGGTEVDFDDPVADATDQSYIDILASNEIVKGYAEDGKQLYKPYNNVTRAQLAKMIVEAMEWEPELVSVKAMDQTIVSGKPTALKFLVNGQEFTQDSFITTYGNQGYSVLFYSSGAAVSAGKVTATADFKYAVQIQHDDGTKHPASIGAADYADVTVVDETVPVKVTEFGLFDSEDNKVDFVAKGDTDTYKIKATKALNALGKEVAVAYLPEVKAATSSNILVASYAASGLNINGVGNVTFTVEWEHAGSALKEKSSLAVEVKAERQVTSLSNKNVKEDLEDQATYNIYNKLAFLDQYGVSFAKPAESDLSITVRKNGVLVPNITTAGKGVYNVTVTLKATDTTPARLIGTYSIEFVDLDGVTEVDYKLVFADEDETELDANKFLIPSTKLTLDLNVEAYKKGVEQSDAYTQDSLYVKVSGGGLIAAVNVAANTALTSDTITVSAVGAGTATITLYTKSVDLEVTVATINVVVKNTSPRILTLNVIAEDGKLNGSENKDDVAAQLTSPDLPVADPDSFVGDMIKSIVFSATDNTLVLTIEDLYGGKVFTYPTNE